MQAPNFSISTLSLTGSLDDKLKAITAAGFRSVELGALDLSGSSDGVSGSVELIKQSGVQISALQEVKDFGGHSGRILAYKMELAKSYLRLMRRLGCRLLIVTPATSTHVKLDADRIAADLRTLATLATPLGVKIGFKPLSWSPSINSYDAAWDLIQQADNSNLSLVLDSYQLQAQMQAPDVLDEIPASAISLVQLSDFAMTSVPLVEDQIDIARHHRLYPGEGSHGASICGLVKYCVDKGFSGDFVFDVYNDKYLAMAPAESIQHAVRSREWILEQIGA
ncbi:sugar phosphate isomerase/epimerase family protein [Marinobacterium mangrovicola]|uniref:Sugar phosphate isomerase/epimerase n=1 Tax=Marinobacterium mangrovicola TaxID=1476959 RepID=A0A4R1GLR0_9GAMM|nr:sugar phosphate isomerase/epimerase family protein [Marinobacterium mangrovicola]TCK09547.1 sugar phosphate isomerase/epimerase [Marinobacterium mangrovicola]